MRITALILAVCLAAAAYILYEIDETSHFADAMTRVTEAYHDEVHDAMGGREIEIVETEDIQVETIQVEEIQVEEIQVETICV